MGLKIVKRDKELVGRKPTKTKKDKSTEPDIKAKTMSDEGMLFFRPQVELCLKCIKCGHKIC